MTDHLVIPVEDVCSHDSLILIPYQGIPIISAIVLSAPPEFNHPLPFDDSSNIIDGQIQIPLVPGTYVFSGTNICGRTYYFTVVVPPTHIPILDVIGTNIPGCSTSTGTIYVLFSCDPLPGGQHDIGGPFLITATMTSAPSTYNHQLPYDVSSFIVTTTGFNPTYTFTNGFVSSLVVGYLSVGDYTFHLVDNCGNTYDQIINVPLSTYSY